MSPSQAVPIISSQSEPRGPSQPPRHSDFLGAAATEYSQDSLDMLSFDDQYSFSLQDDSGLSVDLDSGATSASTDFSGPWPTHDYPHDSLLFGDTSGLLTSMSFPHASSDVPVHDGYYPYNPQIGVSHPTRTLPRIQVATEFPRVAASASGSQRESHSPWAMTPSPLLPPFAPSPSSIGSAPPYTPDTPYHTYTISPRGSPYIDQPAASPVSPSAIMGNGSVYGGDSQMSLPAMAFQPREAASAIDLAAAAGHPLGQRFVPQKTYKPHTLSDRRRYVDEVSLEAPIMFYALNPAGCGISLEDAIKSRFSKLDGRDDPMFEGRGPSVSIRLNWPGYAPWSRQIPTRDFRSPPQPVTRAKLAKNVAKTIARFISEMEGQKQEDPSEAEWRVGGRNGIRLEDLMLVGLQHVSMGSWQAHVRLMRRL